MQYTHDTGGGLDFAGHVTVDILYDIESLKIQKRLVGLVPRFPMGWVRAEEPSVQVVQHNRVAV
jgi:hypothetical protein